MLKDRIVQIHTWHSLDDVRKLDIANSAHYRFTHHGLGIVGGYESFIARSQPLTGAVGFGHPNYRGEFGPAEIVRQTHWSPNLVVLEGPPGTRAWINQNRGSYWLIDGRRPYAQGPIVDRTAVAEGVIPASGRLEFRIAPPFVIFGLITQAVGACVVVVAACWIWGPTLIGRWRSWGHEPPANLATQ